MQFNPTNVDFSKLSKISDEKKCQKIFYENNINDLKIFKLKNDHNSSPFEDKIIKIIKEDFNSINYMWKLVLEIYDKNIRSNEIILKTPFNSSEIYSIMQHINSPINLAKFAKFLIKKECITGNLNVLEFMMKTPIPFFQFDFWKNFFYIISKTCVTEKIILFIEKSMKYSKNIKFQNNKENKISENEREEEEIEENGQVEENWENKIFGNEREEEEIEENGEIEDNVIDENEADWENEIDDQGDVKITEGKKILNKNEDKRYVETNKLNQDRDEKGNKDESKSNKYFEIYFLNIFIYWVQNSLDPNVLIQILEKEKLYSEKVEYYCNFALGKYEQEKIRFLSEDITISIKPNYKDKNNKDFYLHLRFIFKSIKLDFKRISFNKELSSNELIVDKSLNSLKKLIFSDLVLYYNISLDYLKVIDKGVKSLIYYYRTKNSEFEFDSSIRSEIKKNFKGYESPDMKKKQKVLFRKFSLTNVIAYLLDKLKNLIKINEILIEICVLCIVNSKYSISSGKEMLFSFLINNHESIIEYTLKIFLQFLNEYNNQFFKKLLIVIEYFLLKLSDEMSLKNEEIIKEIILKLLSKLNSLVKEQSFELNFRHLVCLLKIQKRIEPNPLDKNESFIDLCSNIANKNSSCNISNINGDNSNNICHYCPNEDQNKNEEYIQKETLINYNYNLIHQQEFIFVENKIKDEYQSDNPIFDLSTNMGLLNFKSFFEAEKSTENNCKINTPLHTSKSNHLLCSDVNNNELLNSNDNFRNNTTSDIINNSNNSYTNDYNSNNGNGSETTENENNTNNTYHDINQKDKTVAEINCNENSNYSKLRSNDRKGLKSKHYKTKSEQYPRESFLEIVDTLKNNVVSQAFKEVYFSLNGLKKINKKK